MKTIEKLRADLAKVGATLDVYDHALHCDAPLGYVWVANGNATITIHYATNRQTWLMQAMRDEKEALEMGLQKATPEETAQINHDHGRGGEGEEPAWVAPENSPEFLPFKLSN
jgi:hypothetical protein